MIIILNILVVLGFILFVFLVFNLFYALYLCYREGIEDKNTRDGAKKSAKFWRDIWDGKESVMRILEIFKKQKKEHNEL